MTGCGQSGGSGQVANDKMPPLESVDTETSSGTNASTEKLNIVATTFPLYDWTRELLGEEADRTDLTLLLNNNIDLHNYQPSVDDIVKITTCDLFIYVGGESDEWVEDVLGNTTNEKMIVINLMETLENAPGIDVRDQSHVHDGDEDEHGYDFDEHVWLSLKNANVYCPVIAEALSSLDPENADVYRDNLKAYSEKLSVLDQEYQDVANVEQTKALIFGDRFPFSHLAEDYRLACYAAFDGCSAESEASFETIMFLAEKVDELGVEYIVVTESSDQSIAKTIKNNTVAKNQEILVMDSMQSMTMSDAEKGTTYISVMTDNLKTLTIALERNNG